ncbi:hypothetical protein APHAL10511_002852 [Amanita phalloides]|nr:hypothetical protein APHAL10511_002852 [Amanita phalloides]
MASATRHSTKLSNSRVLVLGGTSGIGFAVASAALGEGAHVIISGSNPERLEHALSRIRDAFPDEDARRRITGYTCDLSDPEKVEENVLALLQAATSDGAVEAEKEPKSTLLDHIVFTAGNAPTNLPTVQSATVEQIKNAGNIRVLGGFMIAKHALQYMQVTSSSSITVTSGVASAKPSQGWAIAASMLGAVEGMTRGLAVDLAPIRVNGVVPGAVNTEMFSKAFPQQEVLNAVLNNYGKLTLVGHVAKPEDVAEAYIYLMKDHFCTGSLIHTNGGILLK